MKGYKAFNKDWTCNGKVYEVGQTFVENGDPILCSKGIDFYKRFIKRMDAMMLIPGRDIMSFAGP